MAHWHPSLAPLGARTLRAALFGAVLVLLALPAAADRLLGKRDFERAVLLYAGAGEENLLGLACGHRNRLTPPNFGDHRDSPKEDRLCRVTHADRLDQPFRRFPVVFHYLRSHRYYGAQPQRPQDQRGVYIYRFEAGKLENVGQGVFRRMSAAPDTRVPVRAGDVVSWSAIVSNLENESPHDSVPFQEFLITPRGTLIHHCSLWALNGCDPLNPRAATFGLCAGRVKTHDAKGGRPNTSMSFFEPMRDTHCEAAAIVDDGDRWQTVFKRFQRMPQGLGSITTMGNQWVIEDADPPGRYRIEVRLSGRVVGALDFEVLR